MKSAGSVLPWTTSASPLGLQWKRHSIGTPWKREWRSSR